MLPVSYCGDDSLNPPLCHSPFSPRENASPRLSAQAALKGDQDTLFSSTAPSPLTPTSMPALPGVPQTRDSALDDSWSIEWEPPHPTRAVSDSVLRNEPKAVKKLAASTPASMLSSSLEGCGSPLTFCMPVQIPDGVVLARVSARSIIGRGKSGIETSRAWLVRLVVAHNLIFCLPTTLEWKPVYWVIVNRRLWIYRSKADYYPTDYIKVLHYVKIKPVENNANLVYKSVMTHFRAPCKSHTPTSCRSLACTCIHVSIFVRRICCRLNQASLSPRLNMAPPVHDYCLF